MTLLHRIVTRRATPSSRPDPASPQQRRDCFRVSCSFDMHARSEDSSTTTPLRCSDLSATGLRVSANRSFRCNQRFTCVLPTFAKPLVAVARVVRVEAHPDGIAQYIGMQIEHPCQEDEDRLFGHVLDLQRRQIRGDRRALVPVVSVTPAAAIREGERAALLELLHSAELEPLRRMLG